MRCGRRGSLQAEQVTTVGLSRRFPPAKRRMLRRERETFFFGTAIFLSYGSSLQVFKIFQRREWMLCFRDLGASAATYIEVSAAPRTHPFAVGLAKWLK